MQKVRVNFFESESLLAERLKLPLRAARETAERYGAVVDRCEVLQDASTLVVRLSDSLVARVVQDVDGPRRGTAWFSRENAVALHLTRAGAPVIPLHPAVPPGPHEHLGYALNFWEFVTAVDAPVDWHEAGRRLWQCHMALQTFAEVLPRWAIVHETVALLETVVRRELLPTDTLQMVGDFLASSLARLEGARCVALHGDAHMGNVMNTTRGLLWTDWEDAFSGPVEWDLASAIWNAEVLEEDRAGAGAFLDGYRADGGAYDASVLEDCLVARGAVVTAWYPVLYPRMDAGRRGKMERRIEWLRGRVV